MELVYCAYCKHRRKAYTKKHLNLVNIGYSLLLSFLLMLIVWQGFHPGVFVFITVFLFIQETAIQMRRRLSVQCNSCGFDPVLYVRSPDLAKQRVQKILNTKKESAEYLLAANNPFEHIRHNNSKNNLPSESIDNSR